MAETGQQADREGARDGRWSFLRCRLCVRVTAFVVFCVLAIEAAVLVPSYVNLERELVKRLESTGLALLNASLYRNLGSSATGPNLDAGEIDHLYPIVGLTLYDRAGDRVGRYGEAPLVTLDHAADVAGGAVQRDDSSRRVVVWQGEALHGPFIAVVNLDASGVDQDLSDFVWLFVVLTSLIAIVVCGASIAVLAQTTLKPVLRIRSMLLAAKRHPELADQFAVTQAAPHELGEMTRAMNELLGMLASRYRTDIDASEQRFGAFATAASDWFWEMDSHLRFTYFSERFTDLTGVDPVLLLGKTREETGIPDVDSEVWHRHLADLAARRPFRNFVHPRTLPGGKNVWLSINGQPHFDAAGNFIGYRGTGSDVTALKKAENELRLSRDRAEVANRAKSEFLANMSHEIRTPLTGVLGMAELLLQSPLSADQHDKVVTIRRTGETLLGIINDILDLSRLEAGKLDIETLDFHLPNLVQGVAALLVHRAEDKGIDLVCEIAPDCPVGLHGDSLRLRQTLINLAGNAIKFTDKGEVRITVSCRPLEDGRLNLRFEVSDTGIGISENDVERVFGKFEQEDSSTSRRYGGSGLGLSISKQLVELMGGRIGASSRKERGSVFWFELPLERAEGEVPLADRAAADLRSDATRHLDILVAEDNRVNQMLFMGLLGQIGHRIAIAADGEEAVAAAADKSYDVILMDVRMPKMDGMDATLAIRRSVGPNRLTPIIAITADAMVGSDRKFLEVGMNAVATKPINLSLLLKAIDKVLGEEVHQPILNMAPETSDPGEASSQMGSAGRDPVGDFLDRLDRLAVHRGGE